MSRKTPEKQGEFAEMSRNMSQNGADRQIASFAHRPRNEPDKLFVSVQLRILPNRTRQGEGEKAPNIRFHFL